VSFAAVEWAWRQRAGDGTAKAVLILLAFHADEAGECWPGRGRMVARLELSRNTIREAVNRLERAGLLQVVPRFDDRGRRQGTLYRLRVEGGSELTPGGREATRGGSRGDPGEGREPAPNSQGEQKANVFTLGKRRRSQRGGIDRSAYDEVIER
jgi:DNA-binding transcriptional ArsR family regulator